VPSTPVFGWPYLDLGTDPLTYGAVSGEDALLAVEATVADVNTRLATVEGVASELGDAWTAYTPAWTVVTLGTNPTPASHSVTGRWRKIDARLAVIEYLIVGLTSTGWGSGVYLFGLPFAITTTSRDMSVGSGHLLDTGVQEYGCVVKPASTTTLRMYANTANVSNSSPFTLSTGDQIRGSIMVEPA